MEKKHAVLPKEGTDLAEVVSLDIKTKIGEILDLRLENERMVQEGLSEGVVGGHITVEDAAKILNRSKDSVSDLVRIKRLLDGESTDNMTFTKEEITKKLEMVVQFQASGTLEKMDELVGRIGDGNQTGEVVDVVGGSEADIGGGSE